MTRNPKNSLLNSLFSVLHRALPDLQGMKPSSTCCSHLLQRTTSVGLFLPREFGDRERSFPCQNRRVGKGALRAVPTQSRVQQRGHASLCPPYASVRPRPSFFCTRSSKRATLT